MVKTGFATSPRTAVLTVLTIPLIFATTAATGAKITKCQDADGKWHYGTYAAQECAARGNITTIDDKSGLTVEEKAPPPTREELDARAKAEEDAKKEKEQAARQKVIDDRLLSTYDSESAIIEARDRRLEAINKELAFSDAMLAELVEQRADIEERLKRKDLKKNLKDKLEQNQAGVLARIDAYNRAVKRRMDEKVFLEDEFEQLLIRYRELKGAGS